MFDFNPQTPQYGYDQSSSPPSAANPFIAPNSAFGGQGFFDNNFDDSMGPDWRKGRNNFRRFGQQAMPVANHNLFGPLASANSNLFWSQQPANTNPFIFY